LFGTRYRAPAESRLERERGMEDGACDDVTILNVLGKQLHLRTNPKQLNEAGVVWDHAVTALAHACIPELRYRAEKMLQGQQQRKLAILELGAGTGALGIALAHAVPSIGVVLTDLEHVMPLIETNIHYAQEQCYLAPKSSLEASTLAWGCSLSALPNVGEGQDWDVVLGCEILYWGGWNLFSEDTRGPLLKTLIDACGSSTEVYFVFTVRDRNRELSFVLDDIGKYFTLRRLGPLASSKCTGNRESKIAVTKHSEDENNVARNFISSSLEGELVMFGARRWTKHPTGYCDGSVSLVDT
jgi:hypothetical protein